MSTKIIKAQHSLSNKKTQKSSSSIRKYSSGSNYSCNEELKINPMSNFYNISICPQRKSSVDSNSYETPKKAVEYEISSESYQYIKCQSHVSNDSFSDYNTLDSFSYKKQEMEEKWEVCHNESFSIVPKKKNNKNNQVNQINPVTPINPSFFYYPMMTRYQMMQMMYKRYVNTVILEVNLNIMGKQCVFKLRRYDDMFYTVRMFCEINKLDAKFIRPLISYIMSALNSIYGIMNLKLKDEEIEFLQSIKK